MEETDAVTEAKAKGVFNLDNFLSGIAYPVETVTVHTDAYSMNELLKLRAERDKLDAELAKIYKAEEEEKTAQRTIADVTVRESEPLLKKISDITERIEKWDEKVAASAITFELRGMPPAIVEIITKKHFSDPKHDYSGTPEEEARDYEIVAKSIVSVKSPDTEADTSEFTVEKVAKLRGALLEEEYAKLIKTVAHVNLNGALFDQATDATFLS